MYHKYKTAVLQGVNLSRLGIVYLILSDRNILESLALLLLPNLEPSQRGSLALKISKRK